VAFSSEATPNVSGVFEVTVDGENVHSKKAGHGFPDDKKVQEIVAAIKARL